MRKPKREEIPYIFSIIITSIGILYNLYPLSTSNVLILFGIDVLLSMAWWHASTLSRMETSLKKETSFFDRGELPRLSERLGRAKKSVWFMSQSFPRLIGADFGLLEK